MTHTAHEAVQIFYMVSGCCMRVVFGKYERRAEFYFSRFLRMFVPCWTVAVAVLALSVVSGLALGYWGELEPYVKYEGQNGLAGILVASFSNLVIFLQDTVMFLEHDAGESLHFTTDFRTSDHQLWHYMIIPQAWSVAVELSFYIFVPLLARLRTRNLVAVVLCSLVARIVGYEFLGLNDDPWTYRFFPFELALFGAGMLSCRAYKLHQNRLKQWFEKHCDPKLPVYVAQGLCMLPFFWFSAYAAEWLSWHIGQNYADLVSYAAWACALPLFFAISQRNKRDRFIGELSYPIYLVHYFLIFEVLFLLNHIKAGLPEATFSPTAWTGPITTLLSVLSAVAIVKWVIYPLDRKRYDLAAKWSRRFWSAGA